MMKKKIWELGMTVLLLTGVFWLARTGARLTGADAGAGNGVVLIDSGHGGSDPGKIGIHQEKEKDINLQIANRRKYCRGIVIAQERQKGENGEL